MILRLEFALRAALASKLSARSYTSRALGLPDWVRGVAAGGLLYNKHLEYLIFNGFIFKELEISFS
ncbi:TPA: hypothetical protein I8374_003174 [Serratia marcescens]|uniref:hypothetical protein n=1 Tax=Serratia marcescens TaxID=615 RepID=UPI0006698B7D|nr:hypothetical protein [Serratia marcescens]HAT2873935.1 hypothetical protein [Serratia marcescens]HAT2924589.1 hypothetical protein [Serratia marcescens]